MENNDIIIVRPMYTTDKYHKPFVKGIEVAILNGEIIGRHFDNVSYKLPEKYKDYPRKFLTEDIDWELAGYKK